MVAEIKGRNMS